MDTNATGWKAVSMAPGCHLSLLVEEREEMCVYCGAMCGSPPPPRGGFTIPKGDRGICVPTGVMQHEDMMATTQFSSPECLTLV